MEEIPHALELTSPCMMVPFNLIRDKQFLYISGLLEALQDWSGQI